MISTRPVISKSSSPFTNPSVTVPRAPITIGIIVTFMFHSFFNSLGRSSNLYFFSLSFNFTLWSARTSKSIIRQVLFFFIIIRSSRLAEMRWSVCMLKSQGSLCVSYSRTDAGLCIYHLFVWSNSNFLHNSKWITLPTQSCLVLYFLCTNSLHSLNMWLIVSSLSPRNLHLLFCYVLSIIALIWLVLMALFYVAIRKDSVSIIRFPFIIIITRAFHINVSRWFLSGVWVTASLLKSPGLLVFWPFSIMLSFGWSLLVRQLSSPPVPLVMF